MARSWPRHPACRPQVRPAGGRPRPGRPPRRRQACQRPHDRLQQDEWREEECRGGEPPCKAAGTGRRGHQRRGGQQWRQWRRYESGGQPRHGDRQPGPAAEPAGHAGPAGQVLHRPALPEDDQQQRERCAGTRWPADTAGPGAGAAAGPAEAHAGQPGGAAVVVGGQQAQQSVVRVSAPMAAVPQGDQHVTQIDGAEEPLPQLDGVEDSLPQLDGTGDELPPAPAVPAAGAPPPSAGAPPSPSVSEGSGSADAAPPAAPHTANGRSTPSSSATPPPCSPTPSPSPPPSQPAIKIDTTKPFLCEWAGCMKAYKTPKEVENHAIAEHCPIGSDDVPCLWAHCDGMRRKRFSLMTHLQDRHCHPQLMKLMAVRRVQISQSGKSDVPLPPAPPPHPGYAPNAALHAIKRHAVEFVNPKEIAMRDEKEGPVTKSIRLTSSLILRNLVIYSSIGKSRLRAFESHLSTVALSNVESSRTVSQILFDLNTKSEEVGV